MSLITMSIRRSKKQSTQAYVFFSDSRGATFEESTMSVPSVAAACAEVVAEKKARVVSYRSSSNTVVVEIENETPKEIE